LRNQASWSWRCAAWPWLGGFHAASEQDRDFEPRMQFTLSDGSLLLDIKRNSDTEKSGSLVEPQRGVIAQIFAHIYPLSHTGS